MNFWWLVILAGLLLLALALLISAYTKLARQKRLISLQSSEIQKQIKELIQQNQIQEELNREKQQLVGVVSHDLKGPFNRIFALIQLMSMDGDNLTEDQKDYLGKIHQITADGMNMVRNLVDARKMEDKGIDLNLEKINLTAHLAPLIKQYKVLAEKKHIIIEFHAPDRVEILADRMYLSRIVENLLSNALKFSPAEKSIHVTIRKEPNNVMLSVADQGPGISLDDQAKLYQKFQKLSNKPTGGESSTGLGLSIVKRLIERMGGKIECESSEGAGATFTIELPNQVASS
jgi:signal transduction histidine kinase